MKDIPLYLQLQNGFDANSPFSVDNYQVPANFPTHRHDFIEIEFTMSGEGFEIINGISYPLKRGCLCVLLPWHIHEILPDSSNPPDIYKCSFGSELLIDHHSSFNELSNIIENSISLPPVAYLSPEECERMEELFTTLKKEYTGMAFLKDTMCKVLIAEILVSFERCRRLTLRPEFSGKDDGEFSIWKVIQHIHAAFNTDITLEEVAKTFNYNPAYLNRLLKQNIGLYFDEILQEVRIRNACAMLSYPQGNINEIALSVGYQSQEAFSRAFKDVKGMSPKNYQKIYVYSMYADKKAPTFAALNVQIIYFMHLHYSENMTMSTLARQFHYSEDYLREVFNGNSVSFIDLLHEIRIFHACSLLKTTGIPVNEIGFNVGFDSTETFFRVFKKLRGTTPGEYRKCESNGAANITSIDDTEVIRGEHHDK